jgi:hypothetical protein
MEQLSQCRWLCLLKDRKWSMSRGKLTQNYSVEPNNLKQFLHSKPLSILI